MPLATVGSTIWHKGRAVPWASPSSVVIKMAAICPLLVRSCVGATGSREVNSFPSEACGEPRPCRYDTNSNPCLGLALNGFHHPSLPHSFTCAWWSPFFCLIQWVSYPWICLRFEVEAVGAWLWWSFECTHGFLFWEFRAPLLWLLLGL